MSIPLFLAVWVATWAFAWFVYAPLLAPRSMERLAVSVVDQGGSRGDFDRLRESRFRVVASARSVAPFLATAAAFGVEGVLWLIRT